MSTTRHVVSESDTAAQVGSGDLPVLATPRVVAWFEQATFAAARELVDEDHTTVGTIVTVEHVRATEVGEAVDIHCNKAVRDGRRIIFQLKAIGADGEEVAHGKVERAIVDRARFLARFASRHAEADHDAVGATTD